MKVLIVCSVNSGRIVPFILEQAQSLMKIGVSVDYFTIQGKGINGYLKNRKALFKRINKYQPDLIHAHYGLSGLLANLQRNIPVITTYHGSDINNSRVFFFSKMAMLLSAYNLFVSEKNRTKSGMKKKQSLIPCGVDINLFKLKDKTEAQKILGFDSQKRYILFAGAFKNAVKNAELARKAVANFPDVILLELNGYSREEVVLLMNAVDIVLMTSFTEGSPQFIKEAMACNCPIVSVPVGDVPNVIKNVDGCYISTYELTDVSSKIQMALDFQKRTIGRNKIIELGLDSETVAKNILRIYEKLTQN